MGPRLKAAYCSVSQVVVQGRIISIAITIAVFTITINVMAMPVHYKLCKVVVQGRTASRQGQTRIPGAPDGHRCMSLLALSFLRCSFLYEVILVA